MTVEKPPYTFYGCHPMNTLDRPENTYLEAIVFHTTAGGSTIEGLSAWFNGENLKQGMRGSTYAGVDRAGKMGLFLQPYSPKAPIANGQTALARAQGTAKLIVDNGPLNANFWTFNIEHCDAGVPGSLTGIQLENSIWLAAYAWQTWIQPYVHFTGATLDLDHLLQHNVFDPQDRARCASWTLERMNYVLSGMRKLLAGPVPPPTPTPDPPTPTPDPDEWKFKFAKLAGESNQWNVDDRDVATASAILRGQRITDIAEGRS